MTRTKRWLSEPYACWRWGYVIYCLNMGFRSVTIDLRRALDGVTFNAKTGKTASKRVNTIATNLYSGNY